MHYLIIGGGVAGTSAAQAVRARDQKADVTILSEEAHPLYSRIRLTEFLQGSLEPEKLFLKSRQWYEDERITLVTGSTAAAVNASARTVTTSGGRELGYDRLLFATGGRARMPPLEGIGKKGIFSLRTLEDAETILDYAASHRKVLILGGGVLGMEAANSLIKRGNKVTVVEIFDRLLPRQMDAGGAAVLQHEMEKMGFRFFLGCKAREVLGQDTATGLAMADGTRLEADMILVSAGLQPNAELPTQLGLPMNRGVIVDDHLFTGAKDIYAAGDLIEHRGITYGIWAAAQKQGEIAGCNMAGEKAVYEGTAPSNLLKVADISLFSIGDIDAEGKHEAIVDENREAHRYRKLVIRDNRIIGAIFYGDLDGRSPVIRAINEGRDISAVRRELEDWNLGVL